MSENLEKIEEQKEEGLAKSSHYNEGDIQVLEGLEPVRKRPGMYIGSTDERGLHHLITEVVDNSIDEALAGFCEKIEVVFQEDGSCKIDMIIYIEEITIYGFTLTDVALETQIVISKIGQVDITLPKVA